jgi:beta-lactamase class A
MPMPLDSSDVSRLAKTLALAIVPLALAGTQVLACSDASPAAVTAGEAPPAAATSGTPSTSGGPSTPVPGPDPGATDGGAGSDAHADAAVAPPVPVLATPVATLAAEVAMRSPGTGAAIAVLDLKTGEYAGHSDSELHVSASSPKAIWVAAALDHSGIAAVTPYAQLIFRDSDNNAAGSAIDLAGGANAVNVFYSGKAGMVDSALTQWFGNRTATNSPRKLGDDNYFTAKDAVTFLSRLEAGTLIGAAETSQLETWMTWSPRTGFGGWLGTLLPLTVRTSMMHKGGWLPPGCCGDDATYNTLNEIGIVEVAPGHRYAVAILARRGTDWYGKQAPWVERASCVIYRAVSGTPATALSCND